MNRNRFWTVCSSVFAVSLAVSATVASAQAKLQISGMSVHIQRQIDGYTHESFSVSVSTGSQPIKSLRIGQVSGTQYEQARTGLELTSDGSVVGHTAKLLNPGSVEGSFLVVFQHPETTVHVTIVSPAVISCGVAGVLSSSATIAVTGIAVDGEVFPVATDTGLFRFINSPAFWHPSPAARRAAC